jgi:hypothetical protein
VTPAVGEWMSSPPAQTVRAAQAARSATGAEQAARRAAAWTAGAGVSRFTGVKKLTFGRSTSTLQIAHFRNWLSHTCRRHTAIGVHTWPPNPIYSAGSSSSCPSSSFMRATCSSLSSDMPPSSSVAVDAANTITLLACHLAVAFAPL